MKNKLLSVGIVVIGRNEGERLVRCLASVSHLAPQIVYVDSGSTDSSLVEAKSMGAQTVSLDMSQDFTAAKARNAGFNKIIESFPEVEFVQFVDGDCVVNFEWIEAAQFFLINNPKVAVVCGRRRELQPEKSIYNQMCDDEWNTPIGEAKACGGDAMFRASVFKMVAGYKDNLIAGEEPELCIRIRQSGYKIWRLDAEMTLHDANITKFKQWWRRSVRAGHAYAEGAFLHGHAPEYHWVKESRRALVWGVMLPVVIVLMLLVNWKFSILLFLAYPIQIARQTLKASHKSRLVVACLLVVGKFAEAIGQLKFYKKHYLNEKNRLIEYK